MTTRAWYNRDVKITLSGADWSEETVGVEFFALADELHQLVFNFETGIYDKSLPDEETFPLTRTVRSASSEALLTIELDNHDPGNLVCALCEIWEGHSKPEVERAPLPGNQDTASSGTGIYELAQYLELLSEDQDELNRRNTSKKS